MILLLRPIPPFIEFCKVENGQFFVDKTVLDQEGITKIIDNPTQIQGVGYLLSHGGEVFSDTVNMLNKVSLNKISECISFSPECNDLTLKMARIFLKKLSTIPQALFCDTAYFVNLPREASTYAVPYVLREQGVRRYGGYGLIHNWVWQTIQDTSDKNVNKLISIHLGDNPNIAAIKEGKPIETTIGFTSAEGLPSFRGCGDIDPTIVFQLHSKGMPFEGIYDLLSNESGFTALAGEECRYLDIVTDKAAPNISKVKQMLLYDIIKYIGAFASLMGGIDVLVFVTKNLKQSERFIAEICDGLDFLGLSQKGIVREKTPVQNFTGKDSNAKVLYLEQSQWNIMAQEIEEIIKKEMRDGR